MAWWSNNNAASWGCTSSLNPEKVSYVIILRDPTHPRAGYVPVPHVRPVRRARGAGETYRRTNRRQTYRGARRAGRVARAAEPVAERQDGRRQRRFHRAEPEFRAQRHAFGP